MMLYWVASRIVSVTGAFLYPTYASYKTLSRRPTQEADLERWLMYWSVMGCVVGVEYVAEWLIRWIPLYWEIKTIFLLYLALPQTQGATAIYTNRLQPLLNQHEPQIDASVARLRSRAYVFLREKLQELWARLLNQQPGQAGGSSTMQDSAGGPLEMASGLLRMYSPMLLGAAAAAGAMQQPSAPNTAAAGGGHVTPSRSRSSSASSTSSFAPTDINLTARMKPAMQTRSSGAQVRSRNAPKPSRREQQQQKRGGNDFDEVTHSDTDEPSPVSGRGGKTRSAYEKLKAD